MNTEITNSFLHRVHQKVSTLCLSSVVAIIVTVSDSEVLSS